ncbi:MAG: hypothetical protein AAF517_10325 [Planctomycetota bacterium]
MSTAALAIDCTPDGSELYTACHDGGVYRVDAKSGESERVGSHTSYASGVALVGDRHASERTLVSAGYDGRVQFHRAATKETFRKLDAHSFWSWQLGASPNGQLVASVSGQYLCGGYKYEPKPADEPTVKVYSGTTGELVRAFDHLAPVLSVTFSSDSRYLAAGNLMGDVRVWDLQSGEELASWNTPSFTGWGIIKGHYYTGGIYSLAFAPGDETLLCAGMGSTTDPAAGNGRQMWQQFAWREKPAKKIAETHKGESGRGLMETICFHPSGKYFFMAGRVASGKWNAAFFDTKSGKLLHSMSTKTRVTAATFDESGGQLFLSGATSQGNLTKEYGRLETYSVPGKLTLRTF